MLLFFSFKLNVCFILQPVHMLFCIYEEESGKVMEVTILFKWLE